MGKTINVVYAVKDFKNNQNKIVEGVATIQDNGTAEIHTDGNPFAKRLIREQGEWLKRDVFFSEWHLAIKDIVARKLEEEKERNGL